MTAWKDMGTGLRALLLGGSAAAAAVVGTLVWRASEPSATISTDSVAAGDTLPASSQSTSEPEPEAPAPSATSEATPVTPEAQSGTVPASAAEPAHADPAAEQKTVATASDVEEPSTSGDATVGLADTAAQVAASPAPTLVLPKTPNFDVVRVAPDGAAVIAGTAEAGSSVSLRVDGAEVARAETDATGSFVSLFTLEPSDEARVVTMLATLDDGRELPSAASVLIGPTTARTVAAEATPAAGPETATPAPEPTQAEAAAEPAPAGAPEPAAPTAVLLSDEGAKVLQPAAGGDPAVARNVTIDTITYSTSGDVQLSGRAAAGGVVRVYVDNAPLLDTSIAEDGTWAGTLPAVDAGVYTLRADQLNAEGRVLSRYETPFQREAPDLLAAAGAAAVASKITVQPGFTLWGIARESYGDGVMFVRVYEANKTQIRDPDLIYPGQVFTVPAED